MDKKDKRELSVYRLNTAKQDLEYSKLLLTSGGFKVSINRSYYAVFHAMRAVLALEGFDSKKHSGIISKFRQLYVKTGIFDINMSDIIESLFKFRNDADYEDFFVISKDEATEQLEYARKFCNEIETYLKTVWQ